MPLGSLRCLLRPYSSPWPPSARPRGDRTDGRCRAAGTSLPSTPRCHAPRRHGTGILAHPQAGVWRGPPYPPSSSCGAPEVGEQGESGQWLWRPCPHSKGRLLQASTPSPSFPPPQEPVHTAPFREKGRPLSSFVAGPGLEPGPPLRPRRSARALARGRQERGLLRGEGSAGGVPRAGLPGVVPVIRIPWRSPRRKTEPRGHVLPPDAVSVPARRAPGSGHQRPERRSVIVYDCSEEELMASIEQEYCH